MTARICGRYYQHLRGEFSARLTYPLLELGKIGWAQGVCLCHYWDKVDARAETLHDLNVQRLESVASRADEVQASMHSQVDLLRSARLLLLQHVALMLIIQELNDRLPAVPVVHVVTETWGIDDRESDFEELLFQLRFGDLDLDGLVDLLGVAATVVGVVLDGGREEGVDEGGLAQARFTCYHDSEGCTAFGDDLVALVGELQVCAISQMSNISMQQRQCGMEAVNIHWQCQSGSLILPLWLV